MRVRALVKRGLARLGYELVPRDQPRRDTWTSLDELLRRLSGLGLAPKTIIDVGVAYGTPGLYDALRGCGFLWVEPLREYRVVLEELKGRYRGDYVLAAAGPSEGEVVLHVHPDLSGSSVLHETEGPMVDGVPRTVKQISLDAEVQRRGLGGPYLLKIDVQGAELSVLEGAKALLQRTDLLLLEVSLFRFLKEGPVVAEVVSALDAYGFALYDIYGGARRPLDDALGQLDLAFVQKEGDFRKSHAWATAAQRRRLTETRMKYLNP